LDKEFSQFGSPGTLAAISNPAYPNKCKDCISATSWTIFDGHRGPGNFNCLLLDESNCQLTKSKTDIHSFIERHMKSINLYILILIAPALLFSLRIILIEVAALVSVSNYGKELFWVKSLIGKITGSEIKQSEINEELVSILQMISIMISAGESPMMALKHVSTRSEGHLPKLISKSFEKYSNGINLTQTLNFIAVATGSTQVRRLTNSIQIAIQRGTPILDVLNNQVVALNKQINLELLKKSGKSEIALLIPVVFLILPVSISFAIWPSIYGLNQAGF
jgi:tight adherence protein C